MSQVNSLAYSFIKSGRKEDLINLRYHIIMKAAVYIPPNPFNFR